MILVNAESVTHETLQITLQLNEPGTFWCAAAELDGSSVLKNCKEADVQDSTPNTLTDPCYYENFIKGGASDGTVFRAEAHEAYRDYAVEITKIWQNDFTGSDPLTHEHPYKVFCFAEDDWKIEAEAASNSPNYNAP